MRKSHSLSAPLTGTCCATRQLPNKLEHVGKKPAHICWLILPMCFLLEPGYDFHWAPYSEAPAMARPSGQVIALSVKDGCPYLDDFDECENTKATAAAPALEDRSAVYQGQRETRLIEGISISKEGCSKIRTLPQQVHMT